jgi:putative phosphoesterase
LDIEVFGEKRHMKIAFLADIHSNIHALNEVFKKIETLNVNEILCCGDIVGYNSFPKECIELLREKNVKSIKGNHDQIISTDETHLLNKYGIAGVNFNRMVLEDEDIDYLDSLSKNKTIKFEDLEFFITHGSPQDNLFGYVFPWSTDDFLKNISTDINSDVIVLGHTHIQMEAEIDGKIILNPGSVGQPRDSISKACFMVFDTVIKKAEWYRVSYDINAATNANIKNRLPNFTSKRLYLGK